jgi:hypothetical protein
MEWEKTNYRFIAFLDIMGFKNLVNSSTHEHVIMQMEKISIIAKKINSTEFRGTDSKTAIFSDSILIISKNDTVESAIKLMLDTSYLVGKAFELGIPLKGSIAYGKFTADFDNSLFIGQPLIDAYILQEELYLYSVVFHNTFEAFLYNKEYDGKKFYENKRWYKYLTPLKNGMTNHYHLNWAFYVTDTKDEKKEYQNYVLNFYNTVSGKTRTYVDNTLNLYNKMTE